MSTTDRAHPAYPVRLSVAYPDRRLNRLNAAIRILIAIPILILLETVSGGQFTPSKGGDVVAYGAGGTLILGPVLMILFRQKYPRWWFEVSAFPLGS